MIQYPHKTNSFTVNNYLNSLACLKSLASCY